jgi:hypothetical protein
MVFGKCVMKSGWLPVRVTSRSIVLFSQFLKVCARGEILI